MSSAVGSRGSESGAAQTRAAPRPGESSEHRIRGVDPELLRQVRLIELRTRGLVNTLFTGEYRSVFKGQGMEFSEVREYQVGDEVRSIDWNVTARMNRPYVKRYIEERELSVMLVIDLSASGEFGTVNRFKRELAIEVAAVLSMAAARNNDRVGALFFTDRIEHVLPPRKGRRQVLRLLRDLIVFKPSGRGTDMALALDYVNRILKHHSIVFLISDFMSSGIERPLKILARRHDPVAITVDDPAEEILPDMGIARFTDPESDAFIEVDTSNMEVRDSYRRTVQAERELRSRLLRRLAIDEIGLRTDESFMHPLLRFFKARETRRRRG